MGIVAPTFTLGYPTELPSLLLVHGIAPGPTLTIWISTVVMLTDTCVQVEIQNMNKLAN